MTTTTLVPPQSIELEEAILGGILLDPLAISKVADILEPGAFYVNAYREIYQVARELHLQGDPTDLQFVAEKLQAKELIDSVGGFEKLADLVGKTVSAINIDKYAAVVNDKYIRRKLIKISQEIADMAYDQSYLLEDIIDEIEQKIFNLVQSKTDELVSIAETFIETFDSIEQSMVDNKTKGLKTNFYQFDSITNGLQKSDLIILAARPSMGKTALGVDLGVRIAKNHHLPVAIFSLEMSRQQLALRVLAADSEVDSTRLNSGKMTVAEIDLVVESMSNISELPIFINDTASITVNQIKSQARKLQLNQKKPLGMILIDYLQLMEGGENENNRVNFLSKTTRALKGLARELDCPVVVLSQLNRAVESRNEKRPMLSDLRESGSIEQDADIVLMLYRDDYYNPDSPSQGLAELNVVKHRNGALGSVLLFFQSEFARFLNIN